MGENFISNFQDDSRFSVKDHALDRIILPKGSIAEKLRSIGKQNIKNPEYNLFENPAIENFSVVYEDEDRFLDFHSINHYFDDGVDIIIRDKVSGKLFKTHSHTGFVCQLFDKEAPDVCICTNLISVVQLENGGKDIANLMLYRQPHVNKEETAYFCVTSYVMYLLVQHLIMDRPVNLKHRMEKIRYRIQAPGTPEHRKRVVKLVKTVYVDSDTLKEQIIRHFTCECWGVMGHVRTYKSGKKVWIKPYRKGKERNNPEVYCSKDYVDQAV